MIPLVKADLFIETVGTEEQRAKILEQILEVRRSDVNRMENTNEGCWRSSAVYKDIDWLIEGVTTLCNQAINHYKELDPAFANKLTNVNKLQNYYWTNVNEPGSSNDMHVHRGYPFTACYYVQAEGTGLLELCNESNLLSECDVLSPFTTRYQFNPMNGNLFLWPGWIPHRVLTNESNCDRISVAFNLWFTNEEKETK